MRSGDAVLEGCRLIWSICTILRDCEVHGTGLLCSGRFMTVVSLTFPSMANSRSWSSSIFSQRVKAVPTDSDTENVLLPASDGDVLLWVARLMLVPVRAKNFSSPLEAVLSLESAKAMSGSLVFTSMGVVGSVGPFAAFSTTLAWFLPFLVDF